MARNSRKRVDLLDARLVVHAVDQGTARFLQRLGGGDIGEDHVFLDQPIGLQPLRNDHAVDGVVVLEQDFALRQIEIERLPLGARALERFVGRIERLEHGAISSVSVSSSVRPPMASWRLLVGELGGRAHHDAVERVRALAAVGADHHAHGKRGAILARPQRAQIVGNALGQHRHHAVGEVDRIAAHQRFAVERGAGRDVMRDVGDGDADDEAAAIVGGRVRLGVHGVVVILGVGRIDGDERHAPPVLATAERRRLGGVRLDQRLAAEHVRDRMRVDGDQADRAFAGERAELLHHAPGRQAQTRSARSLDRDQVAVLRVGGGAGRNVELLAEHFLVDRLQPAAAVRGFAENPQHALLGPVDDLDEAAAVADAGVLLGLLDMQQHAVAEAGGFARAAPCARWRCGFSAPARAPPRPIRRAWR